ncbi:hypothetical protein GCM10023149_23350 [Mucilaginibacter gynuensis]|uniref:Uncharacterized protein n=1 Tax=Mucilaginibacter gynuensis TaxID=1302236 RepID=A0ABP8GEB6_9SPHI
MNTKFKLQLTATVTALLLIIAGTTKAQTTTPANAPATTADKVSSTIDQANLVKQQLSAFGPVFKKKPKDTVFVFISNIKYTDANLTSLKSNIAAKGKITVKSTLKEGIVILKVIGTNDASVVYDNLDKNLQKIFEASNIEDNKLLLEYKAQ